MSIGWLNRSRPAWAFSRSPESQLMLRLPGVARMDRYGGVAPIRLAMSRLEVTQAMSSNSAPS